jgi:branched-chain amino acid transport system substrate-binding protein
MSMMSAGARSPAPRRKRTPGLLIGSLAGVVALMAAGCSSSSSGSSGGGSSTASSPFTVLNIESLSGALAATASAESAGFPAAAAYINKHGGIDGHKIVVDTVNDNSDPTTAVSDLESYLSSHGKPNVVFPGSSDLEATALLPILAQDGIISFHGSALATYENTKQTPEAYTILGPVTVQEQTIAEYLRSKGYKTAGILSEGIAFTQEETAPLQAALTSVGITSKVENFPATALNVVPEMSALQASKPDVLIVEALAEPAGYALKARAQLNWNIPVVGDPAFGDSQVTSLVPAAETTNVKAVIFKCNEYLPAAQLSQGVSTFLSNVKLTGQAAQQPVNLSATAWDGLLLMQSAAKQAGSIDTSKLVAALNSLKVTTNPLYAIYAGIRFTSADHENLATTVSDYSVAPVGPVVNGLITPSGSAGG